MPISEPRTGALAYELSGRGVPVVLLHGLTFDRRTWDPIVARLAGDVLCIAVDLPGHGQSGGSPMPLDGLAAILRRQLDDLGVDRPVVVGHSMCGGLALLYAAEHPARGAVTLDSPPDLRSFAELVHRLEPALRGPAFTDTFERVFQASMGLDLLAPDIRAAVVAGQRIDQDLVLGYWTELLDTDPNVLQARVDAAMTAITVPVLAIFSRQLAPSDRERLARLPDVEYEVWDGLGHFAHLAAADRFADRLHAFIERCADTPADSQTPQAHVQSPSKAPSHESR